MSISACPRCAQQISIPAGVSSTAKVRCPICREQYVLADALAGLPPLLEVIDELSEPADDWLAAPEAPAMQAAAVEPPAEIMDDDATLDFSEAASEETLDFSEQQPEELEPTAAGADDALFMSDKDTEVEEGGFATSEPHVREVSADFEPIVATSIDEQTMLEVEQRKRDADKVPPPAGDEELLELDFDELEATVEMTSPDATIEFAPPPANAAAAEEELELDFNEFAPVEEIDDSESATIEFSAMPAAATDENAEEPEIDFGEPDANAETIETSALGLSAILARPPPRARRSAWILASPSPSKPKTQPTRSLRTARRKRRPKKPRRKRRRKSSTSSARKCRAAEASSAR